MTEETGFGLRLRTAGVVPVLTISRAEQAVPLARALKAGGLDVLEVTLRTDCALEAIQRMQEADTGCLVGAGTVLNEGDVDAAYKAGADFLVSPGVSPALVPALAEFDGPAIPGVATASEAIARLDEGFSIQKFFPAGPAGGPAFLKALAGPLPGIRFMPTGGVTLSNAQDYLALPNILAVGGSWMASSAMLAEQDWAAITGKAEAAHALARPA